MVRNLKLVGRSKRGVAPPSPAPREAQEIYGREAMARIVATLPPIERAYARARFTIMRPKILSVMDLLLPEEGEILDLGCGFGLFAAYFAQTQPGRRITGLDFDERRVKMATRVFETLGLAGHEFRTGDARALDLEGRFDGIYVLDVMHHVPFEMQVPLLERLRDLLAPGGVLVVKDITTEPAFALEFTRLLDRLMVGLDEPLAYRHHKDWGELLGRLGFHVRMVRVPDVLPYPHVVIAARKA